MSADMTPDTPADMSTSGGGAAAMPWPAWPSLPQARVPEDVIDRIVSVMLMIFLYFFFVGAKLTGFALPVRIEDLIFIALIPMSYRYLARPKGPLFWWIVFYFGINLIPYFAAAVVGEYELSIYPVIALKEMEYFYIAYLICVNRSPWVLRMVDGLSLLMIAYGMRAIVRGEISYYGIGSIGNLSAPSLAGAMYLFSTIWVHMRSKLLKSFALRRVAMLIMMAGGLCVIATVSRSSILALFLYTATYLFLTNLRWIPWLFALAALSVPFVQSIADETGTGYRYIAAEIIQRVGIIGSSAAERTNKWQVYLDEFKPVDFVFGRGKGYPNARDKTIGMGVDSQYVRTIMENGFVGIAIVGAIMILVLIEIYRRGGEIEHAVAIMLAMLLMNIPLEALQVSKSGGFFWLIVFYMLLCQRKQRPGTVPA